MSGPGQSPLPHAPTIGIAAIALEEVLNAPDTQPSLTINGTTLGVEDGQHVTVMLNGRSYDAVVISNTWTASVTAADLMRAVLPDGSYTVTASVSDRDGTLAPPATQKLMLLENLLFLTPGQEREFEQAISESNQRTSKQEVVAPVAPPPYRPPPTIEQRVAAIARGLWPTGRPPEALKNKEAIQELEKYCKTHSIALDFDKHKSQILRALGRKKK
jgi:hypothetical protein